MGIYKRLLRYLKPYLRQLVAALLCMAGVAALTALTMYAIKPVLDKVFIGHDRHMLVLLITVMPALYVVKSLLTFGHNYLVSLIALDAVGDLRKDLFAHLQTLSMDFFTTRSSGKITARMTNDLAALQQVIARIPVYLVRDGLTALCLVGVLFSLSWKFSLATLLILPFSGVAISILGRTLRKLGRREQSQMGELYAVIHENIQGASVVRAYGAEQEERERFNQVNDHFIHLARKFTLTDNLNSPSMELGGALIAAFLLWRGGLDVIQGTWTTGAFFSFMGSALSMYRPLKNFADLNAQIQLGLASAERIFELLDET